MGLAASQARFLALTARKSDVEFQGQQVNQKRTVLTYEQDKLFADMTNILLNDPTADLQLFQNKIDLAHMKDRALELELKNLDTLQQEIQTEIEAVNKVIDKNIDMTFKTFA